MLLSELGITSVFHCSPLHYAPWIVRDAKLLSRRALSERGFRPRHFRSTSSPADVRRGFENMVFCGASAQMELLHAKSQRGFPHFLIEIPGQNIARTRYFLSRRNIAKSRAFRGAKKEPTLDADCETYWEEFLLPVAVTDAQKLAMIGKTKTTKTIEVLLEKEIDLHAGTRFLVFSEEDENSLNSILRRCRSGFETVLSRDHPYTRCARYLTPVNQFIEAAFKDAEWRGNGLEYDDLRKGIVDG